MTGEFQNPSSPLLSLRCVFAPAGVGPRTLFGLHATGSLIHVEDVPSGVSNLTCPDCASALVAKKGRVRRPHFAHRSTAECRSAGETALHRMAKDIVAKNGLFHLPAAKVRGLKKIETVRAETNITFDAVEIEVWENGFRPDLIGIKRTSVNGQSVQRRLIIEIMVTHAVGDRKLEELKRRGESVLQVDLSRVDRSITYEELSALVLQKAPRVWLFHRDATRRAKEVEREEIRLREERAEATRQREAKRKQAQRRFEDDVRRAKAEREESARQAEHRLLEARNEALSAPPKPAPPDLVEWAKVEWDRWWQAGFNRFRNLPADDAIFDAEPDIWRACALHHLAPWRKNSQAGGAAAKLADLASHAVAELERRNLIKSAFMGDRPTSRWLKVLSPPYQAIDDYYRAVLAAYHPAHAVSNEDISLQLPHVLKGLGDAYFGSSMSAHAVYGLIVRSHRRGVSIDLAGRNIPGEVSDGERRQAAQDFVCARRDASLPMPFLTLLQIGQRLDVEPLSQGDHEMLHAQGIRIAASTPVGS